MAPVAIAEPEPLLANLDDVWAAVRHSSNQSGIETAISDARISGFSDVQIAEAMGMAWLRAPRKRTMISVTFVRFKHESLSSNTELGDAYKYGRTPPAVREAEAAEAATRAAATAAALAGEEEEQQEDEEELETEEVQDGGDEDKPRSRWIRWIPGL